MRTRKVRNFGHDITNQGFVSNNHVSIAHNVKKDQSEVQVNYANQTKQVMKLKNNDCQSSCLHQYTDEIMVFGFSYFDKIMGEPNYVSILKSNCELNQPINELNEKSQLEYMFPKSPQLTHPMRNTLIQWIIQVHHKMKLRYETLYLTILLIDKVCCRKIIKKSEYQLLAMTCLFVAGKYEEVATPKIKKIMDLCDRLYQPADLLKMESEILLELNFRISQPTLDWFIGVQIFIMINQEEQSKKISLAAAQKFRRVCFYMAQICLFEIQLLKKYSPQIVSNTIIYTISMKSQFINFDIKKCTKKLNSGELKQMRQCILQIRKLYSQRLNLKYQVINNKYPDLIDEDN